MLPSELLTEDLRKAYAFRKAWGGGEEEEGREEEREEERGGQKYAKLKKFAALIACLLFSRPPVRGVYTINGILSCRLCLKTMISLCALVGISFLGS